MRVPLIILSGAIALLPVEAGTSAPPPPPPATVPFGPGGQLPFSFKYDGRDSATFLSQWQRQTQSATAPDGHLQRFSFQDPATHLKVTVEERTFDQSTAIDWVLTFTNEGAKDTPILEDIQPLDWTTACPASNANLHCAVGSHQDVTDFTPQSTPLPAGGSLMIGTGSGRSSDGENAPAGNSGSFPFFNLEMGDHGVLGAIGWTGNWLAHFTRDVPGQSITMEAGLTKTHLLLHPGESIRTPRILLMNWKGDPEKAQNAWRQLMLADYSPKDVHGKTVTMPITWGTWGTERAAHKLAVIQELHDLKIPADVYWIDAGWYAPIKLAKGQEGDAGSNWAGWRGDWEVSKDTYPHGLRPIGEACRTDGMGFLLWLEAETANGYSHRLREHLDWYMLPAGKSIMKADAFLNLGNPMARKWITGLVSGMVTDDLITWYRQDFNFQPAPYWTNADAPDRIGMSETKSIMGLYQFWDDLRKQHPGLQIDNCASGGRRLDIETMSRSVSLWRSDNAGDPIGEQIHTLGLMPWIPLTEGVWAPLKTSPPHGSAAQLYQQRSAYCAGLCFDDFEDPAAWLKSAFQEFDEVRPYFLGDFHPLSIATPDTKAWAAWQLQKPDGRSGMIVCLRRPDCPTSTYPLELSGIDPQAEYTVEVRNSLQKGPTQKITGQDLQHFQVAIADKPGSALVFYRRR